MPNETPRAQWERYRDAIRGETLPLALIDLDALEANVARITAPVRARGKTIRVASKSVRAPALLRRIADASAGVVTSAMAYAGGECALLVEHGWRDVLLAYPTLQSGDLERIAEANRGGACVSVIADCVEHVDAIARAAVKCEARVPVVIDVDVSFRPAPGIHLGVRRSPLRDAADVVALARRIAARPELRFHGIMAYEAQIAGLADVNAGRRALKRLSRPRVLEARADIVRALTAADLAPAVVNGGGTGSVDANALEPTLTEIAAGSGFVDSHLFDRYRGLDLRPAAFFALQIVRRPAPGFLTCHGGGWIASGPSGRDRAPIPALPEGLALLDLEGAGEVQTPLRVPRALEASLSLGDPVFFRHAKAGELAEHVNEYLFVRGDRIVERAPTYRGLGRSFLG